MSLTGRRIACYIVAPREGRAQLRHLMEDGHHILVVDDHRDIRDPLAAYLRKHGFRVTMAADSIGARDALLKNSIDLVVLDIMMPGENGLALCRDLRASSATPVIFLTAMAEATDRVSGLEIGADDYVVKPFEPRELVARINAVLRRTNMLPPRRSGENPKKVGFESWVFDLDKRELQGADSVSIPLSTAEFRLLEVLVHRPNVVLTRDQLLDLTASRSPQLFDRSIDNQVSRLRRKIEIDPRRPNLIKTVRGDGYVFAADVRTLEP
jgi:two-component system OmpR family response regulator